MKKQSKFDRITQIGNLAVKSARAENFEKGLPNVDSYKRKIAYRLPNGKTVESYSWANKKPH